MYEKVRSAVDISGKKIRLIEVQNSDFSVRGDGSFKYRQPSRIFAPDGKQLIPEGKGFYRSAFGARYQLVD